MHEKEKCEQGPTRRNAHTQQDTQKPKKAKSIGRWAGGPLLLPFRSSFAALVAVFRQLHLSNAGECDPRFGEANPVCRRSKSRLWSQRPAALLQVSQTSPQA